MAHQEKSGFKFSSSSICSSSKTRIVFSLCYNITSLELLNLKGSLKDEDSNVLLGQYPDTAPLNLLQFFAVFQQSFDVPTVIPNPCSAQ